MPALKRTFTIAEPLSEEFDRVAKDMGVGASKLFAMAFSEFIEHRKSRQLFDSINEAYSDYDQADELEIANRAMLMAREVIED